MIKNLTKRFINCSYLLNEVLKISMAMEPGDTTDNIGDDKTNRNVYSPSSNLPQLSEQEQNFYLAKLLIFQMSFSEFYTYLKLNPDAWQYIEKNIVATEGSDMESAIGKMPGIEEFWKDDKFRHFMENTSKKQGKFPDAPDENIVSFLQKAINLFTQEDVNNVTKGRVRSQKKVATSTPGKSKTTKGMIKKKTDSIKKTARKKTVFKKKR